MCAKRIRAGDWLYPNDDYRSPSSRGDPQMPLDFCHPQAPHRKLRIPEWYVSSLMLDRALDAVVRRVKNLNVSMTSRISPATAWTATPGGHAPCSLLLLLRCFLRCFLRC